MATMTVRNLPDDVHRRVRLYAAERGFSVEEAARRILEDRKSTRLNSSHYS